LNLNFAKIKESELRNSLRALNSIVVAYSGGVDSSLLAYYARSVLGAKALIVIAISPSLAKSELDFARQQGKQFNWDVLEIHTDEVENEEYKANNEMRCYFCKTELFECMQKIAKERNFEYLAYGANLDDLSDFRPGHEAARQFKVLSPLQAAQLSKEEIRYLAKEAGLPSWDRPQAACLSSRFPTFVPITVDKLSLVDQAETVLKSLGLKQVRVRHHDQIARIEIDIDELPAFLGDSNKQAIATSKLKELGYKEVIIDPQGYRQGSANAIKH
jgi:pyridinium-3,5-biscarboxylic acid mononucleotide sulfurtransferase